MNKTAFWKISICTATVPARQWERYFLDHPTVQEVYEAVQSESGDWTVMLELLSHLEVPIANSMNVTIKVAATIVGRIDVKQLEAYTK